jgi:5-methylcytosine-specific restriction enzyme A
MLLYGIDLLADHAGRRENESASRSWQAWYKSATWKAVKRHRLTQEPNCRCCAQEGRTVAAQYVGHVEPHGGRWSRFIRYENTQSLCPHHHKLLKRRRA